YLPRYLFQERAAINPEHTAPAPCHRSPPGKAPRLPREYFRNDSLREFVGTWQPQTVARSACIFLALQLHNALRLHQEEHRSLEERLSYLAHMLQGRA